MRANLHQKRIGAILLALALVLAAGPVSAGQIQDFEPDFYASSLAGVEIEVSGPIFRITEAELQHYPNGEGEIVDIASDSSLASIEVSFYDDADTPQQSLDIYLSSMENAADEVEVLDRGMSGDTHYLFVLIQFQGMEIVNYLQVEEDIQGNVDMLQGILTEASMLESDLTVAQAEVLLDGVPFLNNVDPAELAAVAAGNGSLGEIDVSTPSAPEDIVTFPESGVEVGIGPDFDFVGGPESQPDIEVVRIQGPTTLSMVAVGQTGATPEIVLNSFSSGIISNFGGAEVVDEELGDEYAWRLLSIPKDREESTFMLIIVDLNIAPGYEIMQAHEVPAESVAGGLVLIQEQVVLNGAPVMPEIDPEEIADIASGAPTEESTQTPETPDATEESTGNRTGDPRDDARLPDPGDEPDETDGLENTSETDAPVDATAEATIDSGASAADVPGELTDSSWEGGVHRHLVEWDAATWFVDTSFEGDLISDEEFLEDTIVLQTESGDEVSWLYVSVYGGGELTPQGYLDHWVSDEYLAVFTESGATAEVVESRTRGGNSAVLLRVTADNGNEYFVVRQAVALEDGSVLVVTLDTPAAEMMDLYESAQAATIDGESLMRVFSPSQIQRAIGE